MKILVRGLILSTIAAGALALFPGQHAVADQATPVPSASPYVVRIKNFAFSPSALSIPVGATVVWKNDDSTAHTATSTSPAFDSGNLDRGASYSFTFLKAGTYAYVCSYHPNMTGTITVSATTPSPKR